MALLPKRFQLAVLLLIVSSLSAQQRHVQVKTRSLGWPSGSLVRSETARLGLVVDYHVDTTWIPIAEVVAVENRPAPTLAAAPEIVLKDCVALE